MSVSYVPRLQNRNASRGDWFHLKCLGLAKLPDDAWYCSECRVEDSAKCIQFPSNSSASNINNCAD